MWIQRIPSVLLFFVLIIPVFALDISTSYGILRGTNTTTTDGTLVHIFKKIPFAEPPIKELRYELPKPPKAWDGILDATTYGPACMSNSSASNSSKQQKMSEDCLYLNVFIPANCLLPNASCPVVVFLHGGKLSYGNAIKYNDSFIAEKYSTKGIIFVLPAMRLGSFALLTFKDPSIVNRNLIVHDIIISLKWVNSEVGSFGGDNKRVTLMGHSSGGAIAYILALSKDIDPEKNLFHKVISLSGDVFFSTMENALQATEKLLEATGCLMASDWESLKCIREVDAFTLLSIQRNLEDSGHFFSALLFAPPIANPNQNYLKFIEESPVRDILCGGTSMEFAHDENGEGLEIGRFLGLEHENEVSTKFYTDQSNPESMVSKFPSYLSQVVYMTNYRYGGIMENKGARVFLYEFEQPPIPYHASDLPYFIGEHLPFVFSHDDHLLQDLYVNAVSNFVLDLEEPLSGWGQMNGSSGNYLSIKYQTENGEVPQMKSEYHQDIVDYWMKNMTDYDSNLGSQGFPVFPSIFLIIMVVIIIFAVIMFSRQDFSSPESLPLLPKKTILQ